MHRILLLIVALIAFSVEGQTKKTPSKAGPTVQQLQQQIIELQTKLMECQNTAKANEPNPLKDALEAFQTFNSTVDTGVNQAAYKAAVIPLKVKVDKLPDNEQTTLMKKTLEMLVDAGQLWNISFTRNENMQHLAVPTVYVRSYMVKYMEEWNKMDAESRQRDLKYGGCSGRPDEVWAHCVKDLSRILIDKGQENIKGFTTASKP